jgi:osmoprotectant transport system substrate-binding protein
MKQLFEYHGFKVTLDSDNYSEVLRRKMEEDEIDICADYTGTIWMVALGQSYNPGMDNNEVYKLVKDADDHNGFIWMKPIWNNNTYTLASDTSFKAEWGLDTISDLALVFRNKQGKIKTSVGSPFAMRPDGLPGLSRMI